MAPLTTLSSTTVLSRDSARPTSLLDRPSPLSSRSQIKSRSPGNSIPPSSFRPPPSSSASTGTMRPSPPQARHSIPALPSFHRPSSSGPKFLAVLQSPAILTALVARLDWPDFLSLLNTCKTCRSIFRDRNLRDILLARFVPGYADALRYRDFNNYHDIPVSIHDLDLLLISQRLPLHRYPTHALRTLTALYPTLEDDYITAKLIALSRAHSRSVLLLQALVHSSSSPAPPEPEDTCCKSRRPASLRSPGKPNGRQLTFPAPLSYLKEQQQQQRHAPPPHHAAALSAPTVSKRSKHHSLPARSKSIDPSFSHPLNLSHAIRPSADSLSSMISINNSRDSSEAHEVSKKVRRRSLFRQSLVTPPPPEEPRALRFYSNTWRKTSWSNVNHHQLGPNDFASLSVTDEFELKRPKRYFRSMNVSSDSSAASSPGTSPSPLPRTGESSSGSSSPSTPPPNIMSTLPLPSRVTSPHDLTLATSRVRAPILRVFVPCTKMEANSESLLMCENHLVEAGLWEHLSAGDIVCNLGYVPSTSEDVTGEGEEDSSTSPTRLGYRGSGNTTNNSRKWLLFNGEYLVPYIAPDLLPIENPISLPSPFYYMHIMPVGVNVANNIRFWIGKFPPVTDEIPQLAMVNMSGRVRSAKSPSGWVEVKKWVWTAAVVRHRPMISSSEYGGGAVRTQPGEEMGEGWYGEWILEGEGTSEGKQMLLDILNYGVVPGGPREWELVRDKSGGSRIWLRMIT